MEVQPVYVLRHPLDPHRLQLPLAFVSWSPLGDLPLQYLNYHYRLLSLWFSNLDFYLLPQLCSGSQGAWLVQTAWSSPQSLNLLEI